MLIHIEFDRSAVTVDDGTYWLAVVVVTYESAFVFAAADEEVYVLQSFDFYVDCTGLDFSTF